MKKTGMALAAMMMTTAAVQAGGIDRSGQSIGVLFEQGRYVELSFGRVMPSVSGNDIAALGGGASGSVGRDYTQGSLAVKLDFNDRLSGAVILEQPYGADVVYDATSVALGGTTANADATSLTALMRYKFDGGFSVHGGVKAQRSSAEVELRGLAYGGLNGYRVELSDDTGYGYLVGVAYEKPEIALRVALTYNSAVKHKFDTLETLNGAPIGVTPTNVETPQSVSLDAQSGIAKDTLVFGQIKWTNWSNFKLEPATFTGLAGGGLIDLDDVMTYTIGVGRKFNDTWSGAASLSYEKKSDPLVSPLAPTNGRIGVTLAAIYTRDNMKITTGINYTKLGNSQPETGTPDTARAEFRDNDALGIGVKVGFTF